jgi:hypothetical protein
LSPGIQGQGPATPLDPIATLIDAFRSYEIVALVTVRRGEIAPSLCSDSAYMKLRLSRMALIDPPDRKRPPGLVSPAEALMRYCASVRSSPTRGEPR